METQKKVEGKWAWLRGVLESIVYSYMHNNNNKKEIVCFEFILHLLSIFFCS